jgi:hypothetical protein
MRGCQDPGGRRVGHRTFVEQAALLPVALVGGRVEREQSKKPAGDQGDAADPVCRKPRGQRGDKLLAQHREECLDCFTEFARGIAHRHLRGQVSPRCPAIIAQVDEQRAQRLGGQGLPWLRHRYHPGAARRAVAPRAIGPSHQHGQASSISDREVGDRACSFHGHRDVIEAWLHQEPSVTLQLPDPRDGIVEACPHRLELPAKVAHRSGAVERLPRTSSALAWYSMAMPGTPGRLCTRSASPRCRRGRPGWLRR